MFFKIYFTYSRVCVRGRACAHELQTPEKSAGFLGAGVTGVGRMPAWCMGAGVQQGLVTAESSLQLPQSLLLNSV